MRSARPERPRPPGSRCRSFRRRRERMTSWTPATSAESAPPYRPSSPEVERPLKTPTIVLFALASHEPIVRHELVGVHPADPARAPGRGELPAASVRIARPIGVDRDEDIGAKPGRHGCREDDHRPAASLEHGNDRVDDGEVDVELADPGVHRTRPAVTTGVLGRQLIDPSVSRLQRDDRRAFQRDDGARGGRAHGESDDEKQRCARAHTAPAGP
jgi:hypothetical protein